MRPPNLEHSIRLVRCPSYCNGDSELSSRLQANQELVSQLLSILPRSEGKLALVISTFPKGSINFEYRFSSPSDPELLFDKMKSWLGPNFGIDKRPPLPFRDYKFSVDIVRRRRLFDLPNPNFLSTDQRTKRYLDFPGFKMGQSAQAFFSSIPVTMQLRPADGYETRKSLLESLLDSFPAELLVLLTRPESRQISQDVSIAEFYSNKFRQAITRREPVNQDLAGILRDSFEFYETSWNCYDLHLSVACDNKSGCYRIANSFVNSLGGANSFEVSESIKTSINEDVAAFLETQDALPVELPESIARFIHGMQFRYSIHLLPSVFGAPFAEFEKVPGIGTRLVAPFTSQAPLGATEVLTDSKELTKPPDTLVRVGVIASRRLAFPNGPEFSEFLHRQEVEDSRWYCIPTQSLAKHAFIGGETGSGKSTLMGFLLGEINRVGCNFLVVEPAASEYASTLSKVGIQFRRKVFLDIEGHDSENLICWDFLRPPLGVPFRMHASYLKACFSAAFSIPPSMLEFLESAIIAYYKTHGFWNRVGGGSSFKVNIELSAVHPSLRGFVAFFNGTFLPKVLETVSPQNRVEWVGFFNRRFQNLCESPVGEMCDRATTKTVQRFKEHKNGSNTDRRWAEFDELLDSPTIVEMETLTGDDQKLLLMTLMLISIRERRWVENYKGRLPTIPHVLLIEECHRLLANSGNFRGGEQGADPRLQLIDFFANLVAEVRKFNQGVFCITQFPTRISSIALKNLSLKILLRTSWKDDRILIGDAMDLDEDQIAYLARLQKGQYILHDENFSHPLLAVLPGANLQQFF